MDSAAITNKIFTISELVELGEKTNNLRLAQLPKNDQTAPKQDQKPRSQEQKESTD